jgi:hypothetical protein
MGNKEMQVGYRCVAYSFDAAEEKEVLFNTMLLQATSNPSADAGD